MSTRPGPVSHRTDLAIAIGVPTAMLAAAWLLWAISDAALGIGPLDRAAFGWVVVVPLIVLAPAVTGLTATRVSPQRRFLGPLALGTVIVVGTTAALSTVVTQVGCTPVEPPFGAIGQSLVVGMAAGGSYFAAALLASRVAVLGLGHASLLALATGIGAGVLAGAVWLAAFVLAFPVSSCAFVAP